MRIVRMLLSMLNAKIFGFVCMFTVLWFIFGGLKGGVEHIGILVICIAYIVITLILKGKGILRR